MMIKMKKSKMRRKRKLKTMVQRTNSEHLKILSPTLKNGKIDKEL